jgi:WD40 repeat protein
MVRWWYQGDMKVMIIVEYVWRYGMRLLPHVLSYTHYTVTIVYIELDDLVVLSVGRLKDGSVIIAGIEGRKGKGSAGVIIRYAATGAIMNNLFECRYDSHLFLYISIYGDRLLSCDYDDDRGSLSLYDINTGLIRSVDINGIITSSCASHDVGVVVIGYKDDRCVRVWDTCEGACIYVLPHNYDRISSVFVSGDGQTIVCGGYEGDMTVWDSSSMRMRWS